MDQNGEFSFKRILPAVFSVVFLIYFFVNLFTGRTVDPNALDLVQWVIITSLTAVAIEPFSKFRRTTVVSKDAVVTQDANALMDSSVGKSMEQVVQNAVSGDTALAAQAKEEEKGQKVMPEIME